ncbi:hypothetical protein CHUAL_002690 [Chamberlinius hualienensis]
MDPLQCHHINDVFTRFLSWDLEGTGCCISAELQYLVDQDPQPEEAKNGEKLIQFVSENLVTEVLINPQLNTLQQCMKNLMNSYTKHKHIIHAGYSFTGSGSWILQDSTYSFSDFLDAFNDAEVQRLFKTYENCISIHVHCASEGDWTTNRINQESTAKLVKAAVNPTDRCTNLNGIANFVHFLGRYVILQPLEKILEPSDVVGNIRFSRPTLYIFPGGQGDSALFGVNGFNMLIDGGFNRKACFWDFARHLDRVDAVLVTRLNNSNVNGVSAFFKRKAMGQVYPQIGHVFCNIVDRKHSPDGDKDTDSLLISLAEEGHSMMASLRHLGLKPQNCFRDHSIDAINLYHKVGHGNLDMYVLNPGKDSKEVKEFLQQWHSQSSALGSSRIGVKVGNKELLFPLPNLMSICAILVWQPADVTDSITRILFPGSSPQSKIFEGLEKLQHLNVFKTPVCSEQSLKVITTKHKPKSAPFGDIKSTKLSTKHEKVSHDGDFSPPTSKIQPQQQQQPVHIIGKTTVDKDKEMKISKEPKTMSKIQEDKKPEKPEALKSIKSDEKKVEIKQQTKPEQKKAEKLQEKRKPYQFTTTKVIEPQTTRPTTNGSKTSSKHSTPAESSHSKSAPKAKGLKEATNKKAAEEKNKATAKKTTTTSSSPVKKVTDSAPKPVKKIQRPQTKPEQPTVPTEKSKIIEKPKSLIASSTEDSMELDNQQIQDSTEEEKVSVDEKQSLDEEVQGEKEAVNKRSEELKEMVESSHTITGDEEDSTMMSSVVGNKLFDSLEHEQDVDSLEINEPKQVQVQAEAQETPQVAEEYEEHFDDRLQKLETILKQYKDISSSISRLPDLKKGGDEQSQIEEAEEVKPPQKSQEIQKIIEEKLDVIDDVLKMSPASAVEAKIKISPNVEDEISPSQSVLLKDEKRSAFETTETDLKIVPTNLEDEEKVQETVKSKVDHGQLSPSIKITSDDVPTTTIQTVESSYEMFAHKTELEEQTEGPQIVITPQTDSPFQPEDNFAKEKAQTITSTSNVQVSNVEIEDVKSSSEDVKVQTKPKLDEKLTDYYIKDDLHEIESKIEEQKAQKETVEADECSKTAVVPSSKMEEAEISQPEANIRPISPTTPLIPKDVCVKDLKLKDEVISEVQSPKPLQLTETKHEIESKPETPIPVQRVIPAPVEFLRTPDEVADLPIHEEVPTEYDGYYHFGNKRYQDSSDYYKDLAPVGTEEEFEKPLQQSFLSSSDVKDEVVAKDEPIFISNLNADHAEIVNLSEVTSASNSPQSPPHSPKDKEAKEEHNGFVKAASLTMRDAGEREKDKEVPITDVNTKTELGKPEMLLMTMPTDVETEIKMKLETETKMDVTKSSPEVKQIEMKQSTTLEEIPGGFTHIEPSIKDNIYQISDSKIALDKVKDTREQHQQLTSILSKQIDDETQQSFAPKDDKHLEPTIEQLVKDSAEIKKETMFEDYKHFESQSDKMAEPHIEEENLFEILSKDQQRLESLNKDDKMIETLTKEEEKHIETSVKAQIKDDKIAETSDKVEKHIETSVKAQIKDEKIAETSAKDEKLVETITDEKIAETSAKDEKLLETSIKAQIKDDKIVETSAKDEILVETKEKHIETSIKAQITDEKIDETSDKDEKLVETVHKDEQNVEIFSKDDQLHFESHFEHDKKTETHFKEEEKQLELLSKDDQGLSKDDQHHKGLYKSDQQFESHIEIGKMTETHFKEEKSLEPISKDDKFHVESHIEHEKQTEIHSKEETALGKDDQGPCKDDVHFGSPSKDDKIIETRTKEEKHSDEISTDQKLADTIIKEESVKEQSIIKTESHIKDEVKISEDKTAKQKKHTEIQMKHDDESKIDDKQLKISDETEVKTKPKDESAKFDDSQTIIDKIEDEAIKYETQIESFDEKKVSSIEDQTKTDEFQHQIFKSDEKDLFTELSQSLSSDKTQEIHHTKDVESEMIKEEKSPEKSSVDKSTEKQAQEIKHETEMPHQDEITEKFSTEKPLKDEKLETKVDPKISHLHEDDEIIKTSVKLDEAKFEETKSSVDIASSTTQSTSSIKPTETIKKLSDDEFKVETAVKHLDVADKEIPSSKDEKKSEEKLHLSEIQDKPKDTSEDIFSSVKETIPKVTAKDEHDYETLPQSPKNPTAIHKDDKLVLETETISKVTSKDDHSSETSPQPPQSPKEIHKDDKLVLETETTPKIASKDEHSSETSPQPPQSPKEIHKEDKLVLETQTISKITSKDEHSSETLPISPKGIHKDEKLVLETETIPKITSKDEIGSETLPKSLKDIQKDDKLVLETETISKITSKDDHSSGTLPQPPKSPKEIHKEDKLVLETETISKITSKDEHSSETLPISPKEIHKDEKLVLETETTPKITSKEEIGSETLSKSPKDIQKDDKLVVESELKSKETAFKTSEMKDDNKVDIFPPVKDQFEAKIGSEQPQSVIKDVQIQEATQLRGSEDISRASEPIKPDISHSIPPTTTQTKTEIRSTSPPRPHYEEPWSSLHSQMLKDQEKEKEKDTSITDHMWGTEDRMTPVETMKKSEEKWIDDDTILSHHQHHHSMRESSPELDTNPFNIDPMTQSFYDFTTSTSSRFIQADEKPMDFETPHSVVEEEMVTSTLSQKEANSYDEKDKEDIGGIHHSTTDQTVLFQRQHSPTLPMYTKTYQAEGDDEHLQVAIGRERAETFITDDNVLKQQQQQQVRKVSAMEQSYHSDYDQTNIFSYEAEREDEDFSSPQQILPRPQSSSGEDEHYQQGQESLLNRAIPDVAHSPMYISADDDTEEEYKAPEYQDDQRSSDIEYESPYHKPILSSAMPQFVKSYPRLDDATSDESDLEIGQHSQEISRSGHHHLQRVHSGGRGAQSENWELFDKEANNIQLQEQVDNESFMMSKETYEDVEGRDVQCEERYSPICTPEYGAGYTHRELSGKESPELQRKPRSFTSKEIHRHGVEGTESPYPTSAGSGAVSLSSPGDDLSSSISIQDDKRQGVKPTSKHPFDEWDEPMGLPSPPPPPPPPSTSDQKSKSLKKQQAPSKKGDNLISMDNKDKDKDKSSDQQLNGKSEESKKNTSENNGKSEKQWKKSQLTQSPKRSPMPSGGSRSSPVKTKRPDSPLSTVESHHHRRSTPINKLNTAPVYVDLTYIPHHGNPFYADVEFFRTIRARYYVFSGTNPSKEVFNALLEAKQSWEDPDLEVTIIPTYDTDTLGYWFAVNEELLSKLKIDLAPSASRCTINLQDHETSCSAYRLEF